MAIRKLFQELNLSDSFLFAAVSQDEKMCRLIIEIILGKSVGKLTVNAEDTILYSSDYRGIRLGTHAHAVLEVWCNLNIEMQNRDEKNISHRSRYNQGVLDVSSLRPGQDFTEMENCYVIFIGNFDPGGEKRYCYTAKMTYKETGVPIGDGATRIFLNTKGTNRDGVSDELVYFLGYVNNSTKEYAESTEDRKIMELHKMVEELKNDRRLEEKYMRVQDLLDIEYLKGRKDGFMNGEKDGYTKGVTAQAQAAARNMYQRGYSVEDAAGLLEITEELVRQWYGEWD